MPRGVKKPTRALDKDNDIVKKIEAQINRGRKLSIIEFSVSPEDLRETYVRKQLAANQHIDEFVLNWCKDDLKKEVATAQFKRGTRVEKKILDTLDAEVLEIYLNSRANSYDTLHQYEIDLLTQQQLDTYLQRLTTSANYIEKSTFDMMSETMKLTYILNHGVMHVDPDIQDWFELWKKAKGRDYRIEQIFLD
jgi:hypothetical protein